MLAPPRRITGTSIETAHRGRSASPATLLITAGITCIRVSNGHLAAGPVSPGMRGKLASVDDRFRPLARLGARERNGDISRPRHGGSASSPVPESSYAGVRQSRGRNCPQAATWSGFAALAVMAAPRRERQRHELATLVVGVLLLREGSSIPAPVADSLGARGLTGSRSSQRSNLDRREPFVEAVGRIAARTGRPGLGRRCSSTARTRRGSRRAAEHGPSPGEQTTWVR